MNKICRAVIVVCAATVTTGFSFFDANGESGMLATASARGSQLFKLSASDSTLFNLFGTSVAMSGNIAIVGSPGANADAGAAYLFNATTGQQLLKLGGAAVQDVFGSSVGISGNTAIVGATEEPDPYDHSRTFNGSAYLFDVTTGNELSKLTPSSPPTGDDFGYAVAISGNTAIVGSPRGGRDYTGSAYLFDLTTGQELFELTSSDARENDYFGYSVAISGNTAIVGAIFGGVFPHRRGSVYLFNISNGQQLLELTALDVPEGDEADLFGYSVAATDNIAIIGAPGVDDAGPSSGAAYLFNLATGQQIRKLDASDAAELNVFGTAVAISGKTAIVGSPGDEHAGTKTGSSYLFDVSTGEEFTKLTALDAAAYDLFGASVAINSNTAIVGSPLYPLVSATPPGSAYLYSIVPEPSTFLLLVLAVTGIYTRRGQVA